MIDNQLTDRVVLITGASGGIGSSCARRLWANGASLALTYSSGEDRINSLIAELRRGSTSGAEARTISSHQLDLSNQDHLNGIIEAVASSHGHPPDVVVHVAGYAKVHRQIEDISLDEFDLMINLNLRSTFILTKAALPYMKEKGWGRLVFVSSISAQGGGINGCHYAASKAAVNGMMLNISRKVAHLGITANCISPAMIGDTGIIPDESVLVGTPGEVSNIPVGRLGSPDECANVVEMFCKTGYLTGQCVLLSGGLH